MQSNVGINPAVYGVHWGGVDSSDSALWADCWVCPCPRRRPGSVQGPPASHPWGGLSARLPLHPHPPPRPAWTTLPWGEVWKVGPCLRILPVLYSLTEYCVCVCVFLLHSDWYEVVDSYCLRRFYRQICARLTALMKIRFSTVWVVWPDALWPLKVNNKNLYWETSFGRILSSDLFG